MVAFSKPGLHMQWSGLLALEYEKVLEPVGQGLQMRLSWSRYKLSAQATQEMGV